MTPQEIQEFFEREGYYPVRVAPPRPQKVGSIAPTARGSEMAHRRLALKGWRAPLHWQVPPAFENAAWAYETLGHEDYCAAVKEYYEGFGQIRIEQAQRWHDRWAVRQVLRMFETQVRGFRGQHVGRNGAIFGRALGQEKFGQGRRVVYQDILTLPETLIKDGRIMYDLGVYLKAYGVHDVAAAERLVRAKLRGTWGVAA